jgi:hypothetical protein
LAESPVPGRNGRFVGPYALVIFAIALGLLVVCNPSRRRDRAKPEQYGDKLAKELAKGR